jgi:hypothetical protein
MSEEYWKQNYNTKLSVQEESQFKQWTDAQSKVLKRNISKDDSDYDLRGYWLNKNDKPEEAGHMPDKYKKPNHPTFSNESIYHGEPDPKGGAFDGGKWSGNDKSGWTFEPTYRMLTTTHKVEDLKRYMADNEKGVKLKLPRLYPPFSKVSERDALYNAAMKEDEEAERN